MREPRPSLLLAVLALCLEGCAPAAPPDWRVDASKSTPWAPPPGLPSCPVDDTLSPRRSVWRLYQVLDAVKGAHPGAPDHSTPANLVLPESLVIREILRHDPCVREALAGASAPWRWIVLLVRGERVVDSLELPWREGVAAQPRGRGSDSDGEDEWSLEGLDGACLAAWAQVRYGKALDQGLDSDSALARVLAPRVADLRRSRAGAEVTVDLQRWKLSVSKRSGACP